MRTKEEINKAIAELKEEQDTDLKQGGGGVENPYPYDRMIKFLEWVIEDKRSYNHRFENNITAASEKLGVSLTWLRRGEKGRNARFVARRNKSNHRIYSEQDLIALKAFIKPHYRRRQL